MHGITNNTKKSLIDGKLSKIYKTNYALKTNEV